MNEMQIGRVRNERHAPAFSLSPRSPFFFQKQPLPSCPPAIAKHAHISERFGARLRALRTAHGMTQLQVADRFGIDRSYISEVERGRKGISLPLLEVLALGFKVSLSDLLRGI